MQILSTFLPYSFLILFSLFFDLSEETIVGVSDLRASASDVGSSIDSNLFEDSTVAASFVFYIFLSSFDLNRREGTDCLSR